MKRLSDAQKSFLKEATRRYASALPGSPGEEYLAERGLARAPGIERFALGYVDDPLEGHEPYRGWLAIPYLRPGACASIRFRCLQDHEHEGHGKYMTPAGDQPWLYNTEALRGDRVGICEGELDAVTLTACGLPTVGVPGVEAWQESWTRLFEGFAEVLIVSDGDVPGRKFSRRIAQGIETARIVELGEGQDANQYMNDYGVKALRQRVTVSHQERIK